MDEMQRGYSDSFFVSIDFTKAFDTISHDFLYQILGKYGFSAQFINFIKELFRDAGSNILINGHKSKKIKLKSGSRQGGGQPTLPMTLLTNYWQGGVIT